MNATVLFALPGGPELLVVLGIGILLFGADRIPQLARSVGEATGELKKGKIESEKEIEKVESEVKDAEPEQKSDEPDSIEEEETEEEQNQTDDEENGEKDDEN